MLQTYTVIRAFQQCYNNSCQTVYTSCVIQHAFMNATRL